MSGFLTQGRLRFGRADNTPTRYHDIEVRNSSTASDNWMKFHIHDGTPPDAVVTPLTLTGENRVGIGTTSPSEKLEVNGTIKATDINFTGLPTYADEAAATTGGLSTGDLYKTATGEIRIKL